MTLADPRSRCYLLASRAGQETVVAERSWTVERARDHFSEVVAAAERGEPQLVTKRGRPAAYVVSAELFAAMTSTAGPEPADFVGYLLSAPKAPPGVDVDALFAREPFVDRPGPFDDEA